MSDRNSFGAIQAQYSSKANSAILLQPITYDGTSSWGKGADRGFDAFLEASFNMELFDIETQSEVYKEGIHLLPEPGPFSSPGEMYQAVYELTSHLLKTDKFLSFFGGEHSISIGIIDAYKKHFQDLTVLQIDAHADLRPSYDGSEFNHACAMHRASKTCNLIQVGIRSMDVSEKEFIDPFKCFYADQIMQDDAWMNESISLMTKNVYISFDLDALDPSIMPSTGTPEPGGMDYYQVLRFLSKVFERRNVVGFDLVELAPIQGLSAPQFLVAKLYYKMLSYKFSNGKD